MILTVSRFNAAIGVELVTEALSKREHLAETAPGFLGMSAFTDSSEGSVIYLVTKWTDEASYRAWFDGPNQQSDAGISFALRSAFRDASILERVAGHDERLSSVQQAVTSTPILSTFLQQSRNVHLLTVSLDGTIRSFNDTAAEQLKVPASQLTGLKIWGYLNEEDATRLWRRIQSNVNGPNEKFLLNFVDAEHFSYTLECRLDVQQDHFTLLGELPESGDKLLREHLLQFRNSVAALSRENGRKRAELEKSRAELEKALNDLDTSYWHMRKISEYLPICMQCHKVRTAEARWEDVADYLNKHSLFLTHSLCPPCYDAMAADVNRLKQTRR
jgi:heme-degrading monooxygenase HmoA